MNKSYIEKFNQARILIFGLGREGKSMKLFLETHCQPAKLDVFEGKYQDIVEDDYDVIIKSPGIRVDEVSDKYTSMTEIFLECFRDITIGVTGTKGKSTTSSFIYEALKAGTDKKIFLMGNIGLPALDYFDEIDENSLCVFELSAHQMAHAKISPHVAVFLNLFPEHLDYYDTVERYGRAKSHIAEFQEEGDFFFAGDTVPGEYGCAAVERTVLTEPEKDFFKLSVNGFANEYNANCALEVARVCGANLDNAKKGIESFTGLPHRLKFVGNKDGIDYYDDSISTIPEACINAVKSISNAKTVLVGGMDRGIDYSKLVDFIFKTPEINFVLMYETGVRILVELGCKPDNCFISQDLSEALDIAKRITPEGSAIILSPAAASYGYFKNFEERGDKFIELALVTE